MKTVAFFLRSPKFSGDWSLDEAAVPLSGTDGTMLFLVRTVMESGLFKVVLLGGAPPMEGGLDFHAARTLPEAFEAARATRAERMIFNGATIDELREMMSRPAEGPQLILWTQNSPNFGWLCAAMKLPQPLRIVAVSDWQRYGFSSHSIYRQTLSIPNPAPKSGTWKKPGPHPGGERKRICYIGALKISKGFHHLARIWPEFRVRHPDISLEVCGSSSLYDPGSECGGAGLTEDAYEREIFGHLGGSRESAAALGVNFHGSLAKDRLRSVLDDSLFAVVNPNLTGSTETFCCSAVEAQCMGVPVVGAYAGALKETVGHGLGGLLFKNEREFLRYMLRLTEDASLRERLAGQGFTNVTQSYAREKIARRWLLFLQGEKIEPFCGNIGRWAIWDDHARKLQRLLPLGVASALRKFKVKLRYLCLIPLPPVLL